MDEERVEEKAEEEKPEKIRPLGLYVLVRLDPSEKQVGSIIIPEGKYLESECFATVEGVGTGKIPKGRVKMDVKDGDRILMIRMHERTSSNEKMQKRLGDGRIFIRYPDDILGVVEE